MEIFEIITRKDYSCSLYAKSLEKHYNFLIGNPLNDFRLFCLKFALANYF